MKIPTKQPSALAETLQGIAALPVPAGREIDGILYDEKDQPIGFAEKPKFTVKTDADADWLLGRLMDKESELVGILARRNTKIEAIKRNTGGRLNRLINSVEWFRLRWKPELELFGKSAVLKANAGKSENQKTKNFTCDNGRIQFKAAAPSATHKQEHYPHAPEVLPLLRKTFPDAVRDFYTVKPDKDKLVFDMLSKHYDAKTVAAIIDIEPVFVYAVLNEKQQKEFDDLYNSNEKISDAFDYVAPGAETCSVTTGVKGVPKSFKSLIYIEKEGGEDAE